MGSQQYCLRWNNHQSSVMSVFSKLLSNESLVDVTLACEGAKLKAHRVVLSACSPYFQEIFEDNPCQHPVVILKDFTFSELRSLIDFIYKGEVNINQQCLDSFLKTAESLQISGLANVSTEDQTASAQTPPAGTSYSSSGRGSRGGHGGRQSRVPASATSSSREAAELSVTSLCEVTVDDGSVHPNFCSDVIRLDEALQGASRDGGVSQITSDVETAAGQQQQSSSRLMAKGRPSTRPRLERNVSDGGGGSSSIASRSSSAAAGGAECMMQEIIEPTVMVKEEIEIVDDELDFGEDLDSNFSRATDNQDSIHGEMVDQTSECPETMIEAVSPDNVWSFLEIGLSDDPESADKVFIKGSEDGGSSSRQWNTSITVVECRNAVGRVLAPFVLYCAEDGRPEPWWTLGYDEAVYAASPSGWLETPTFDRWFAEILLPVLQTQPGPKLLVGNYSPDCMSDDVFDRCARTDTDFVAAPATSAGLMRPFGASFAELYGETWHVILSEWRNSEEGQRLVRLPKSRFPSLLRRLRCAMPTPLHLTSTSVQDDCSPAAGKSGNSKMIMKKTKTLEQLPMMSAGKSDCDRSSLDTLKRANTSTLGRPLAKRGRRTADPGPSTSVQQLLPELRRRIMSPDTGFRMKQLKTDRNSTTSTLRDDAHLPKRTKTRRRCAYCATKNLDRRSDLNCATCDVALCKNCFDPYHRSKSGPKT